MTSMPVNQKLENMYELLNKNIYKYHNVIHILRIISNSDKLSKNKDLENLIDVLNDDFRIINSINPIQQDLSTYDKLLDTLFIMIKRYCVEVTIPLFPYN